MPQRTSAPTVAVWGIKKVIPAGNSPTHPVAFFKGYQLVMRFFTAFASSNRLELFPSLWGTQFFCHSTILSSHPGEDFK